MIIKLLNVIFQLYLEDSTAFVIPIDISFLSHRFLKPLFLLAKKSFILYYMKNTIIISVFLTIANPCYALANNLDSEKIETFSDTFVAASKLEAFARSLMGVAGFIGSIGLIKTDFSSAYSNYVLNTNMPAVLSKLEDVKTQNIGNASIYETAEKLKKSEADFCVRAQFASRAAL